MPFYTYDQNNSHGIFKEPAHYVIVEADNAVEADAIAIQHGVYFDPDFNRDCECCGQRWTPMSSPWRTSEPTDEPLIYGKPPEKASKTTWLMDQSVPMHIIIRKEV